MAGKVLVVEDYKDTREMMLTYILQGEVYDVIPSANGCGALRIIEHDGADVALLNRMLLRHGRDPALARENRGQFRLASAAAHGALGRVQTGGGGAGGRDHNLRARTIASRPLNFLLGTMATAQSLQEYN